MSWIVNIIQIFSGGKLHLHGFDLINQMKWWDWNSLACSMSLKICHWFQASGANQHLHVFQLWSPPPSNMVEIIVGTPSIRAAYDGLHLWYLNKYTEESASTGDTNCNCNRFFKIREIVLLLNHQNILLTPTENRRQCSCGPRFPRIIFSFHVSDLLSWPKHNSRVFFFFGSVNEGTVSSAKGSIAFHHFPNKPQHENFKPAQSCVSTDESFSLIEGVLNWAAH